MGNMSNKAESIGEVFHKEKNQKKNNKTKGQYDSLKKYGNHGTKSRDKLAVSESQIKREANYMKHIHVDTCYDQLKSAGLIIDESEQWRSWWCGTIAKLGVTFVQAQAQRASKGARDPGNPAPLFRWLINKELNKAIDPYMPRFNRTERSDS